jgi:hypothetical protein
MANKKKRVRRTKEQIALDNAREQAMQDMENEFDSEAPSEGVGDTLAKVFKATGVDKLVKFIAGEDCGCDERRKKLNELLPYPVKCLNEEEYNYLDNFFSGNPLKVQPSEQVEMVKISRRIFNRNFEVSGCAGCVRDMVNRLETVYNEYGN